VVRRRAEGVIVLDRGAWAALSIAEQRGVLRAAIRELAPDLGDLGLVHIVEAARLGHRMAGEGAIALSGGLVLRREYDTLTLARAGVEYHCIDAPAMPAGELGPVFAAGDAIAWQTGGWIFEARLLAPDADLTPFHADPLAAALAVRPGAQIALRARRPGDRFQPRGMGGHSQKLSDTLINMRVPAHLRDQIPLLTVDGAIAWFVAPSGEQIRGRVAEFIAPKGAPDRVLIAVRWGKINPRQ
jgi:tRNA(Ile)-lysidine synthase